MKKFYKNIFSIMILVGLDFLSMASCGAYAGSNICSSIEGDVAFIESNFQIFQDGNASLPVQYRYQNQSYPVGVTFGGVPQELTNFIAGSINSLFYDFNSRIKYNFIEKTSVIYIYMDKPDTQREDLISDVKTLILTASQLKGLGGVPIDANEFAMHTIDGARSRIASMAPGIVFSNKYIFDDNDSILFAIMNLGEKTSVSEFSDTERKRLLGNIVLDMGLPPVNEFGNSIFTNGGGAKEPTSVDIAMLRVLATIHKLDDWRSGLDKARSQCSQGLNF